MDVQQNQTFLTEGKPPPYVFTQLQPPAHACLSASAVSPLLLVVTVSLSFTLLCACVAPCSEELAEDDLGDLQALVSGVTQVRGLLLLLRPPQRSWLVVNAFLCPDLAIHPPAQEAEADARSGRCP